MDSDSVPRLLEPDAGEPCRHDVIEVILELRIDIQTIHGSLNGSVRGISREPLGRWEKRMSNAIKQSGAYLEIVSFHLGDQEFCIDIMAIREIRGWAPVTPMPHTPPYVLGLINLRGAVIPVIDMACRLGMKMTEPSERSAIIVTDIAGKLVGLLVEQVSDMMTIRSEDLQPAPEIIPEAQRAFCRGIVALEKTMVCFLNLDTVIADELTREAA